MSNILRVEGNALTFGNRTYRCTIGRGGLIAAESKCEGDGCTPIGTWALRECWYRADRLKTPKTLLPLHAITHEDGWCDDPAHPLYNHHVSLPFAAHHEKLWLEEQLYDLVVPLGYNDDPVVSGKGSAIFLHVASPDYVPTQGCVALAREDLLEVLPQLSAATTMQIV